MKKILYSLISGILLLLGISCKKDSTQFKNTANLYVVNAAVGAGSIKVKAGAESGFSYKNVNAIAFAGNASVPAYVGDNNIFIVSALDTTSTLFNRSVNIQAISTLYLAGISPIIDTIYRVETAVPFLRYTVNNPDSSIYVRFVNLLPGSNPLNVSIGSATVNEVNNLAYKGVSIFKKYTAVNNTGDYQFVVKDATTNTVVANSTLSVGNNRFKTISLIIAGQSGSSNPVRIFAVQYY